ncbi:MAG TPA: SDR family NAD(P)-dependent oxidoreductase [Herpetosiphonaceae bacterium]
MVLGCRDLERGNAAATAIQRATGTTRVAVLRLDVADQQSIRSAVRAFKHTYDRLDVLINNAAVYTAARRLTPDGLEVMLATNHLGPFLLTTLLYDPAELPTPSRILTLTAPSTTELTFDDLQGTQHWRAVRAFGASKMCNLLCTCELARRLAGTGVTVNAVHPGLVRSDFMQEAAAPIRWLLKLVSSTPEQAAAGPVYLASSPAVADVTGTFFKGTQPIAASPYAHAPAVQQRLWRVSAKLTHVA